MSISMWLFIVFFTSVDVCGAADASETAEVMEGDALYLHPGVDLKGSFQILWSYESGNQSTRVAQIYQGKTYTHYDERFTRRVHIDPETGALTISNIRTNESGLFEAFIVIDKEISRRMFSVDVSAAVPLVTVLQPAGTTQARNTSTHQPKELHPPNKDCQDHCGVTEALVRLVLSGLVGIAIVFFLVEHLWFCSVLGRDDSA